jgi:hypothetical protein
MIFEPNRRILINTLSVNNSPMSIFQIRGEAVVKSVLENLDFNAYNRNLLVRVSNPFPCDNIIGVNTFCTGNSETLDFALDARAANGRTNYGIYAESSGNGVYVLHLTTQTQSYYERVVKL